MPNWIRGVPREPTAFRTPGRGGTQVKGQMLHNMVTCGLARPRSTASWHFGIGVNAKPGGHDIVQFVALTDGSWHAHGASRSYTSYEIASDRPQGQGSCAVSSNQADAVAWLVAQELKFWRKKGINLPLKRAAGAAFNQGIKTHADGLQNPGAWNPNRHWDNGCITKDRDYIPASWGPWGFGKFKRRVEHYLGEDTARFRVLVFVNGERVKRTRLLREKGAEKRVATIAGRRKARGHVVIKPNGNEVRFRSFERALKALEFHIGEMRKDKSVSLLAKQKGIEIRVVRVR